MLVDPFCQWAAQLAIGKSIGRNGLNARQPVDGERAKPHGEFHLVNIHQDRRGMLHPDNDRRGSDSRQAGGVAVKFSDTLERRVHLEAVAIDHFRLSRREMVAAVI
jgi:hypothetical protein